MSLSQKAAQMVQKRRDTPIDTSKASKCCCAIAPWSIKEEGRSYRLEIMDMIEGEPARKEPNNPKKRRYELHVVALPPHENGRPSFKKITSEHRFLDRECRLSVIARYDDKELSLHEGDSLFVNSDAAVRGFFESKCVETRKLMPNGDEYRTLKAYIDDLNLSDEQIACYLRELKSLEVEKEEKQEDLERVLAAIFNPQSTAKEIKLVPTGSSKCALLPNPVIYLYPYTKVGGNFKFLYTKAHKTAVGGSKSRVEQIRAKLDISGSFHMYRGSRITTIGGSIQKGGGSYIRKKKRQYSERRAKKSIFGTMEKILNFFKEIERAQNEHNKKIQRSSKAQKHPLFKFEPGSTGLGVTVKEYELKEIDSSHEVDYAVDIILDIYLLQGVDIKIDCIEFLIIAATAKAPYAANILSSARDRLEDGVGGDNAKIKAGAIVELGLSGGIKGRFEFKKDLQRPIYIKRSGIQGSIGFSAKVMIEGEGKLLFVQVSGKAGGEAASVDSALVPSSFKLEASLRERDGKLQIGGGIWFNGLALYYVLKVELKVKEGDDSDKKKPNGFGKSGGSVSATATKENKYDGKIVLFDKWEEDRAERYCELQELFY